MTLPDIAWLVGGIAGILASIGVIWTFFNRLKATLEKTITATVTSLLESREATQEKQIKFALEASQQLILKDIKALETRVLDYVERQEELNTRDYKAIKLLKESLIEAYKKNIRDIYYKLRETGVVTDMDKGYVDRIFPKYQALGGNSDIAAKYDEMCRVYQSTTQEAYRNAREKYVRDKKELKNEHKKNIEEINKISETNKKD